MYKKALAYVEHFDEALKGGFGILLYGIPGTGKTYMSSCIANALIKKDIPVIVISADGIIERIKDTFNNHGADSTHIVINSLDNAALLVIDDLGAENDSDWTRTMIYRIIDNRYRIKKPMIITTNFLSLVSIKERYDQRTFERMITMATPVEYQGKSLRRYESKDSKMFFEKL
jgi:DNA replication protein DnaC